jgi:hypothetical protein
VDAELKQAVSAATSKYDKKQKCVKLEKVERAKAMTISSITTKVPTGGVLHQLDASLVVKVGDFVNVLADLLAFKMLHGGKGFVTRKETKDGVSTFIVKYLETEAGSTNHHESSIPVFRLTITPFTIFGDRPKLPLGNPVVAPEENSNSAEHSASTPGECLQEGFANGRAEGWR